ncbi:MAG: M12 family metallo-peptidase [Thermoanaerobaculia bacterium]
MRGTIAALSQGSRRRAVGVSDGPIQIDVMEVYGPTFLHQIGSAEKAAIVIQHQIATTNQALQNSGLGKISLNLRHARFSRDYDSFPAPNPAADIVQDRAYFGADLLGFGVGSTPIGIAAAACRPPAYGPDCGVHWVQTQNYLQHPDAYAHEVGHNLGGDHDAPNTMPREVDPHPYARAHCEPGQWRTIMSYGNPCRENVVLFFSNPNRFFRGAPTGVPELEDNARVIALSAPLVRDYYPPTNNTGPRCEFNITFDRGEVPVEGTTRTLVAERTRGDCEPSLGSLDDWIHVDVASSSTLERTEAQVTYGANESPLSRRGHFVVGEQPVSIEQAGAGACLLPNGSFDRDVSGWTVTANSMAQGTVSWSTVDAANDPNSGSAMLTLRNGGQFHIERCVAVEPSSKYILRSSVYMPPGQSTVPTDLPAYQSVSFFDTPDCSGSDSGGGDFVANIPGVWLPIESTYNTYANSHSAKISLRVHVAANSFTTYFDDMHFCRTGIATPQSVIARRRE